MYLRTLANIKTIAAATFHNAKILYLLRRLNKGIKYAVINSSFKFFTQTISLSFTAITVAAIISSL